MHMKKLRNLDFLLQSIFIDIFNLSFFRYMNTFYVICLIAIKIFIQKIEIKK